MATRRVTKEDKIELYEDMMMEGSIKGGIWRDVVCLVLMDGTASRTLYNVKVLGTVVAG